MTTTALTPAQRRYLAEIQAAPGRKYNGRALAILTRLRDRGLIRIALDVRGHVNGRHSFVIAAWPNTDESSRE